MLRQRCNIPSADWQVEEAEREREPYHERHYPTHGGHILYREHDMIPEHEGIHNPDWDARGRYM